MTHVETYTPGHTANAVTFMARRQAATHAAFLLPYVKPGDRVLDCGCGPGRITRDLARIVGPGGAVTGIDRTIEQVGDLSQPATADASAIRFEAADIYALPFADGSFDVVLAHALFEHLRDPAAAAQEVLRVLRPGGIVGLRSPDWGGFLLDPMDAEIEGAIRRYEKLMTDNGGDIFAGRKLARLLRDAGAGEVWASATYETYEDTSLIADYLAAQMTAIDPQSATALTCWGRKPGAVFIQAWGEAIGRKTTERTQERNANRPA